MSQMLNLARAAHLVGVPRGVLQRMISSGEIASFDGLIAVTDIGVLTDDHDGHGGGGHFNGPGTIPEGKKALQVSVVLANTTDHKAAYSPDAFVLRIGADDLVGHSDATFLRGSLLPGGIIRSRKPKPNGDRRRPPVSQNTAGPWPRA